MFKKTLGLFFLLGTSHSIAATSGPYLSGHGGFVSITDVEGGLGVGGQIGYHTGDLFGLDLSVTYTTAGPGKLNIPLALTTNVFEQNQLTTYLRFGGGFVALHGTKFMLDFGFGGDFHANANLSFGLVFRYDIVFDGQDQGLVLLRATYHLPGFGGEGDDIWD